MALFDIAFVGKRRFIYIHEYNCLALIFSSREKRAMKDPVVVNH